MKFARSLAAVLILLAAAGCASKEAVRPDGPEAEPEAISGTPRIEVLYIRMTGGGEFVDIRFRMYGIRKYDPEPSNSYVIDEATGEKFYITFLRRIGRLATTKGDKDGSIQFLNIKNREGKLKAGSLITVVAGPARQEHVVIGE